MNVVVGVMMCQVDIFRNDRTNIIGFVFSLLPIRMIVSQHVVVVFDVPFDPVDGFYHLLVFQVHFSCFSLFFLFPILLPVEIKSERREGVGEGEG